jgi:2-polyprenyl-3-methyl-5-hydroxy-6-metoxy-1,4-benzoquinol methylase
VIISPSQKEQIAESLKEHLSRHDTTNISTAAIQKNHDELVWARQLTIEKLVVPWINRVRPLKGLNVLEPGCGCGPATCAFAEAGCNLLSYEIDHVMVKAAQERLRILGLEGPIVLYWTPEQAMNSCFDLYPDGFDAVFLIGILEHIPDVPRVNLMMSLWEILRPGGLFVVAHTPNRLTYTDLHTSHQPFVHMLPDEIAIRYYNRSPHDAYRASMEWASRQSHDRHIQMRHGFGTAVSFHDFEIAFEVKDLKPLIVDDGMGPEMMAWYAPSIEERLLWEYMQNKDVQLPQGFSRQFLNLIFKKP